jgi:hypothetical protein
VQTSTAANAISLSLVKMIRVFLHAKLPLLCAAETMMLLTAWHTSQPGFAGFRKSQKMLWIDL